MDRFERLLYGGLGGSEGGEGGGASRRRHNERRAEGYGERRRERRKERHAVVERGSREVEPEGRRKEEREQIAGRSGGHGRRQASEGRTKGSKLEQSKSAHHRSSQSHGARKPAKDSKDDGFIKVGVLLVGDGVPPLDLACVDLLRLLGELDDIELDGEEMRGEDSGGKKGHVAESRAKETGKEDTSVKEQPQERKPAAEEVSMKEITVKEQPEGGKTAAEGILTKEIPVKEQPEGKAVMERPADEQIVAEEPWEVVAGEEPPAQQKATEELPGKTESGEVQDAEAKPLAEAPKTVLKSVSFAENGARLTLLRKYSGSSLDRVTKENTKLNSDCLAVINRAPRFKFYFIMETINGLHHKSVGVKMVLTNTIDTCPPLDLLIICSSYPAPRESMPITRFVSWQYNHVSAIFTIGAGIASLIDTGILNNRAATGRRDKLPRMTLKWPRVNWEEKRWVRDGKVWTTANGITALDMMLAFARETYPKRVVDTLLRKTGAREGRQEYD